LSALGIATFIVSNALYPDLLREGGADVANPLGKGAGSLLLGIAGIGFLAMMVGMVASLLSLVLRYRQSTRQVRQQIKWFAYLVVLCAAIFLIALFGNDMTQGLVNTLIIACLPFAVALAILRYRLYDIDLIIRRTLIYTLLTAALLVVYLGSVVLLQQLFRALVGHSNQLSIVISTLAIAALFNPLRQRIQEFIDRRFYRRKYDAQKTLAAFGQTVRNEVELEQLTGELLRVIEETMQPAHVSLWLRDVTEESKELP
ncbi:MAG: hypothetical protein M3220_07935, partial [Chloroflexota bacterium]|nr:hypothetical protein [Chloroflexota bacterium]